MLMQSKSRSNQVAVVINPCLLPEKLSGLREDPSSVGLSFPICPGRRLTRSVFSIVWSTGGKPDDLAWYEWALVNLKL